MKGHPEVIDRLQELLAYDVTAMETYLIQARLLDNWGYKRLAQRVRHEADDELGHVERQMDRLVFLDAVPDLSRRPSVSLGANVREILEGDLALELRVSQMLNAAVALCEKHGDAGTRKLFEELLVDTEMDHIKWLETELRLIEAIGYEAYLAEQLFGSGASST